MNVSCIHSDGFIYNNEILFYLIKQNNEEIYYILEKNKNLVNSKDENGNSLLHWAVFLNNVYLVYYLLENDADPNIKSNNNQTPVFWAVSSNNIFMIYLLKKYKCNLYEVDNKGYNCLTISIQYNYLLPFLYLINLKLPLTCKDFDNCSIIDWASYNNNIFFLRLFSIFVNNLYLINFEKPGSILQKAIIGNAFESVVYLITNRHQNIYDISTDDNKNIIEFIEEYKDKIDPRIYTFLKSKQIGELCKQNRKTNFDALYEYNGHIGPYLIRKKKNLSIIQNVLLKYSQNKALIIYPLLVVLAYTYLNIVYYFYVRMHTKHKNLFLDLFHPLLFVIYYFVVSSNPGYLDDSKLGILGENSSKENEIKQKKKYLKDGHNKMNIEQENTDKQNLTFQYIIKNIEEEIKAYEMKYKLNEFSKGIKSKNIFELKNNLNIKWKINKFEISTFNINLLCPTCFLFKNVRTKHCAFCDKCIDIFDHHCIFTLNCMGIDNARIFLSWILSNILFSIYNLYFYLLFIIKIKFNYHNIYFYICLSVLTISLLFIYFMGTVFLRSVFNILENITLNEKIKLYSSKKFFTYELKIGENNEPIVVRKFKNPFDRGVYKNVLNFLKKSKNELTQNQKKFIEIDENIQSDQVRQFVEGLNKKLGQFYEKHD
ncbi:palmitoyltransferase DHHC5, putative [Plasmodium yoelii]|uniref:Palmitoyltransferase n=2 Tax=Plasmodium yoelii TaxID=5861 RepID=A0AAE9WTP8_PLAYO|nr:palmitoyltransferase DHHC5, putative [Plasmodium yoelii]WBY60138.1 palmitoyltransferase DHHC5 [Plasmodium yoelii yoelii]CDU20045.1 palmitoyltransferase, putative [Plasmodium yoelii]VTZ80803.1 palmitoyltransferase DHHC5, putative [Plasmodium yoelii]|eukprot:XP_022813655.1 palmitoyltransferase DHHC5, putative [Plasmodium yoelii]